MYVAEGVTVPEPVGVLAPEAFGLCSRDGGTESPAGPRENRGACLGWADTPVSSDDGTREPDCEVDICGVTMSAAALALAS